MIIPLLNIYQILSTISYIICCSQFSKSFCLCFALRFCFGPVSTPVIFLLSYCAHLFCVRSLICLPVVSEQLCKFLSCFCNVKSKSYLSFLTQSFPGFCPRLFLIFFWIMDYGLCYFAPARALDSLFFAYNSWIDKNKALHTCFLPYALTWYSSVVLVGLQTSRCFSHLCREYNLSIIC